MAARSAALADFGRVFGQRTPGGQIAEQHFALADDGGEDAVELMRDAAGQLADGLHFLRLKQLRFDAACAR